MQQTIAVALNQRTCDRKSIVLLRALIVAGKWLIDGQLIVFLEIYVGM